MSERTQAGSRSADRPGRRAETGPARRMMSTIAAGGPSSPPGSPSGSSTSSSKQRHTSFSKNLPDDKRKRKLELNRIASRESRKRKKRRLEELQRSVLYLTHENHQLREQNELLRQMLVGRLPILPQATGAEGEAPSGEQQQEQVPQQQEVAALLTTSKEEVTDAVALPPPLVPLLEGSRPPQSPMAITRHRPHDVRGRRTSRS